MRIKGLNGRMGRNENSIVFFPFLNKLNLFFGPSGTNYLKLLLPQEKDKKEKDKEGI